MYPEDEPESKPSPEQERPATLWGWIRTASPTVKAIVAAGIMILLGNALLIAYVSAVTTGALDFSTKPPGSPGSAAPNGANRPMTELDYEKYFVEAYEKSMLISARLVQLAEGGVERDGDWHREVSVQVTLLKTLANNASEVVPPAVPGYASVHTTHLKAFAEFKWAADNLLPAATGNDAKLQEASVKRLNAGRELMNKAVNQLKDAYGKE